MQASRQLLEEEFPVEALVLDEIESQSVERVRRAALPIAPTIARRGGALCPSPTRAGIRCRPFLFTINSNIPA